MQRPQILFEGEYQHSDVEALKALPHWQIKDIYSLQLAELYEIDHPDQSAGLSEEGLTRFKSEIAGKDLTTNGNWVCYPWNGNIIHMVTQQQFDRLRTNRNQLLVTSQEQQQLLQSHIAVLGLSIGSHFVSSMAYSGIGGKFKLADFDKLSTTNLNRIQARLVDINESKIDIISRQIYDLNPYQEIEVFEQGLNEDTMASFMSGSGQPAVIFEAIDDFVMKVRVRLAAREKRIPVIMITNLGDSLLLDVERYDIDDRLPIFNGAIGTTPEEILNSPITEQDKVRFAVKIVDFNHVPTRALETLMEINKTLVGRPQLASTVTIGGGVAAYMARQIILNQPLPSGRYHTTIQSWFGVPPEADSQSRKDIIQKLKAGFNI